MIYLDFQKFVDKVPHRRLLFNWCHWPTCSRSVDMAICGRPQSHYIYKSLVKTIIWQLRYIDFINGDLDLLFQGQRLGLFLTPGTPLTRQAMGTPGAHWCTTWTSVRFAKVETKVQADGLGSSRYTCANRKRWGVQRASRYCGLLWALSLALSRSFTIVRNCCPVMCDAGSIPWPFSRETLVVRAWKDVNETPTSSSNHLMLLCLSTTSSLNISNRLQPNRSYPLEKYTKIYENLL